MNGFLYVLISLLIILELLGIATLAFIAWKLFDNNL